MVSWCPGTLFSSERSALSEMPLSEGGRSASSVFTTNPAELMLCLQVCQLFNSPPATLASICPGSFLLDQLCFQFVEFRHVVPMAKQAGLSTVSVLGVSRHRRRKVLLGGLLRLCFSDCSTANGSLLDATVLKDY